MPSRRAVFLDRDGTIIHDRGYPRDPALVELLPGAANGLTILRERGLLLVVVSNQSGLARGLVTPAEAKAVHRRFLTCLAEQGLVLDGVYYCPHGPDEDCSCRKPAPGLILQAAAELKIDLSRSFMTGDKRSDVEAGIRAGCTSILFNNWTQLLEELLPRLETVP
jgi:D-glycero-D-manno-heptose 1,7-bisphosphate phosphatase